MKRANFKELKQMVETVKKQVTESEKAGAKTPRIKERLLANLSETIVLLDTIKQLEGQ